jgi:hypothetical protein
VYADTILGTGINIQSNGKTGYGTLKINSVIYQAQNLTIQMGNTVKISGDIYSGTDKSKLAITGIKVKDTLYNFVGLLIGKNGATNVKLDLYIVPANPTMPKSTPTTTTQKTIQQNQIKLVVKSFNSVASRFPYSFEVKTFDKKSNPAGDFDQKNGKISGVKISAVLVDSTGKIIMKFNGVTDSQGSYSDSKTVAYNVSSNNVTYKAIFNATKSGYLSDSVVKTVYILSAGRK